MATPTRRGVTWAALPFLTLLAACTPAHLRPLDYAPPPSVSELWNTSPDRCLRYNGHLGECPVPPDKKEVVVQPAGDLESRVRTLATAEPDQPTVTVVAVTNFGTPAYYEAVKRTLDEVKAEAVVCAVDALGLGGGKKAPPSPVLRDICVTLRPDLLLTTEGLHADQRFLRPTLREADQELLDREGLRREPPPAVADSLRVAVADYGRDVMLHFVIFHLLGLPPPAKRPPVKDPVPDEPAAPGTFRDELHRLSGFPKGEERRQAFLRAFVTYRLRDACLETVTACAAAGGRRIAIVCLPETAAAITSTLRTQGYKATKDAWLVAIPVLGAVPLTEPPPAAPPPKTEKPEKR